MQYGTTTITTSATQIIGSSRNRTGWMITNNGTAVIYVGFDTSVTTSNGMPIAEGEKFISNGDKIWRGAIYGIVGTGTQNVRFQEWSDNDIM